MNGEKVAERKSDETRAKIFEFAVAFVEEHGVEQLTMRRLAEKAAVSPALIIQYFGSKAQLLNLIFDERNQAVMDRITAGELSLDGDTPEDVLQNVVGILLDRDYGQPDLTLAVMASSFLWTDEEESAFEQRLEPFLNMTIDALVKTTPGLHRDDARAACVMLLMCYTQSIRIIIRRRAERAIALSWMAAQIRVISNGIRGLSS